MRQSVRILNRHSGFFGQAHANDDIVTMSPSHVEFLAEVSDLQLSVSSMTLLLASVQ